MDVRTQIHIFKKIHIFNFHSFKLIQPNNLENVC